MKDFLLKFKQYCKERNWIIDQYTSEFTLQFRLCRYIDSIDSNFNIELESNINRYGLYNLTKKEIDIDFYKKDTGRSSIEVKFIRDKGSFNIGMFKFYEDIKFVEELVNSSQFKNGFCLLFTSIPEIYTSPNKNINPRNKENLTLYNSFRNDKTLKGTVAIRTGKINQSITIEGIYKLCWIDFCDGIKSCMVEII